MDPNTAPEPAENPYAAPHASATPDDSSAGFPAFADDTKREIRTTYLRQEASIKTISIYYYVTPIVGLVQVLLVPFPDGATQAIARQSPNPEAVLLVVRATMIGSAAFGLLVFPVLAYNLSRFRNWARWVITIILAFGLFGLVVTIARSGNLLPYSGAAVMITIASSLYMLFVLSRSDSSVVFTRAYRQTVAETPQLVARLNARDWAFVAVIGVQYLVAVAGNIRH